jgi:hypothetical protein
MKRMLGRGAGESAARMHEPRRKRPRKAKPRLRQEVRGARPEPEFWGGFMGFREKADF